jgi:hypothetical protein
LSKVIPESEDTKSQEAKNAQALCGMAGMVATAPGTVAHAVTTLKYYRIRYQQRAAPACLY